MTITLKSSKSKESFKPRILVFGIGGAGGNAVNNMIKSNLDGVEFYAVNTDAQALEYSLAESKIQLGKNVTGGLGAGAMPEIGKKATEENAEEIMNIINGANMLFITAGMGGGTGTGSAPVIAEMARNAGILTVAVVTKPFDFEGKARQKIAESGITELKKHVDTLIVIPNQNLFRVANERTSFVDAFKIADDVLYNGVKCVTDLITMPGLVNLDFADVRTVMKNMGMAMMSSGESSGEDRAIKAAEAAIINPLLDISSVDGAKGILINVTGGTDMTLFEVNDAVEKIRSNLDESSNIIFGAIFNEKYDGLIRVSVVATGVEDGRDNFVQKKSISVKKETKMQTELNSSGDLEFDSSLKTVNQSRDVDLEDENDDKMEDDGDSMYIQNEDDSGRSYTETEDLFNAKNKSSLEDDDDVENIILDEYSFPKIVEPTRDVMLKKVYKENGIEKDFSNNRSNEDKSVEKRTDAKKGKNGISSILNNIIFGS